MQSSSLILFILIMFFSIAFFISIGIVLCLVHRCFVRKIFNENFKSNTMESLLELNEMNFEKVSIVIKQ